MLKADYKEKPYLHCKESKNLRRYEDLQLNPQDIYTYILVSWLYSIQFPTFAKNDKSDKDEEFGQFNEDATKRRAVNACIYKFQCYQVTRYMKSSSPTLKSKRRTKGG